jgi:uncharacterized membrane protein
MSGKEQRGTKTEPGWRAWIDLVAVVAVVVLTTVLAVQPATEGSPIRFLLGIAFISFLPGYAFIAALFPDAGSPRLRRNDWFATERFRRHEIDIVERIALALALSVAITALVGVVLGLTPWGVDPGTLFVSIGVVTVALAAVAAVRRWRLAPKERFSLPVGTGTASGPSSGRRRVLNVALGVAVTAAVSSVIYAIASPREGERYTELQLLTEDDGEVVAADYPREFTAGEGQPLVVGVENHERETVAYTVVVLLEALEGDETVEAEELDRFGLELDHGERERGEHTVTPELVGEELRLSYLLYAGEPPAEPTQENAYEHVHIWIDVAEA